MDDLKNAQRSRVGYVCKKRSLVTLAHCMQCFSHPRSIDRQAKVEEVFDDDVRQTTRADPGYGVIDHEATSGPTPSRLDRRL